MMGQGFNLLCVCSGLVYHQVPITSTFPIRNSPSFITDKSSQIKFHSISILPILVEIILLLSMQADPFALTE